MTQNLLLFSIGTTTWGVGDQDITAVTAARPLHRLPLSPPSVAGMALIDEKPVTVFDLGACLGAPPLSDPHKGSFLLVTREDRTTAFAVAGKVDRLDSGSFGVVSLPAPARSPVVESCLLREASVIPIINIQHLLERVKQGDLEIPLALSPSAAEERETSGPSSVLVISLAGERFCVDAANATYREGRPGEITSLPYARQLAGVIPEGQGVVPVLPLSERIGLEARSSGAGMIVTEIDGLRWGLPVDREEGRLESVTVLRLPAVARPPWSRGAVIEKSEVVPLIGLSSAGSTLLESRDEDYLAGQYHPASAFPGIFRKGSVEVIELSLFGTCHAVPKDEVAEVLPFLPFRTLTQVSEIVLGVAELKGRLLPVLDLEAIFGRRSPVTPQWKMLRITNGDFEALVVVGTVLGNKELPPDMQRQIPIAIPHQVLYGCYLDASAVRLILNVEALAVHFEKTEIRDLLAEMSPPMPAIEGPLKEQAKMSSPVEPASEPRAASAVAVTGHPAPAAMHVSEVPYKDAGAGAGSQWRAPRMDNEPSPTTKQAAVEEEQRRSGEEARKGAETEARERSEAEARVKAEAEARQRLVEEERLRIEKEAGQRRESEQREQAEAEARTRAEQETRDRVAEEERRKLEEGTRNRQAEEERRRLEQEAAKRSEAEARERLEAESRTRAVEEFRQRIDEDEQRRAAEAEAKQRANERLQEVVNEELQTRAMAGNATAPSSARPDAEGEARRLKHPVVAALAVLALAAMLFYIFGRAPEPLKSAKEAAPPSVEHAPARIEPKAEIKKEPEAPLYLSVPPSMPKPETVIYVVVKGDTLWGIAKRFTGNPFNYPRVARDNSIATPDLIFPGQKIKLIQEKR